MVKSRPSDVFKVRLKSARESRRLSQAELAEKAGLQPAAVSHFETGARKPSFDNLRRIADALEVSTDYLLGRSDTPTGTASADVLLRDGEHLTADDLEVIRGLAAQMAAKRKGERGGRGS